MLILSLEFFLRHFLMRSFACYDTFVLGSNAIGLFMMFRSSYFFVILKGLLSKRSSYIIIPRDQMSMDSSQLSPCSISGQRQMGVPQKVVRISPVPLQTDHPKSLTLMTPQIKKESTSWSRMFQGLTSRWMMRFWCRQPTAEQVCCMSPTTYFSTNFLFRWSKNSFKCPSKLASIIMQKFFQSEKYPQTLMMLGLLMKSWILSSRMSCMAMSSALTNYFYRILIAQMNPDFFYLAKKTLPKAPWPSSFKKWKWLRLTVGLMLQEEASKVLFLPLIYFIYFMKDGIYFFRVFSLSEFLRVAGGIGFQYILRWVYYCLSFGNSFFTFENYCVKSAEDFAIQSLLNLVISQFQLCFLVFITL